MNAAAKTLKNENIDIFKFFLKNQGVWDYDVGSELSLVSGRYPEEKCSNGVDLASFFAQIRHVFGDTFFSEAILEHSLQLII